MHPGRADVIGAGALILDRVLRRTRVDALLVSESDILDAAGGVDTGWTFYTPYSTTYSNRHVIAALGVFITGFSSILTGLNFIVTIHTMRAPG